MDDSHSADPTAQAPAGDPASTVIDNATGDTDVTTSSICTTGRFHCHAKLRTDAAATPRFAADVRPDAAPPGFGPADLQSAYNIDINPTPSAAILAHPTVALIDAFGYPALESDLAAYRSQFGLPPCTVANGCLKIVNQQGQTSPLPGLTPDPTNDDWTIETALDMDMVSAACPRCNILIVQADDDMGNGLIDGQNTAASLGATVISNSWGGPENPKATPADVAASEAFFNHPGIAVFASAGDDGYDDVFVTGTTPKGPEYPGTSAFVIAVGGTHLVRQPDAKNPSRGWTETAWSSGGSACSTTITKPAYQTASPCTFKATTDIAAVGDPQTGLAVFNAGTWVVVGGTSASAPFVASIFASTGNGNQTSGAFIAANAAKLNDVVSGANGKTKTGDACAPQTLLCNAAVGWDGPTGFGTPNARALTVGGDTSTNTGSGSNSGSGSNGSNGSDTSGDSSNELTGGCSVATGASTGAAGGAFVLVALVGIGLSRRPRRSTR